MSHLSCYGNMSLFLDYTNKNQTIQQSINPVDSTHSHQLPQSSAQPCPSVLMCPLIFRSDNPVSMVRGEHTLAGWKGKQTERKWSSTCCPLSAAEASRCSPHTARRVFSTDRWLVMTFIELGTWWELIIQMNGAGS